MRLGSIAALAASIALAIGMSSGPATAGPSAGPAVAGATAAGAVASAEVATPAGAAGVAVEVSATGNGMTAASRALAVAVARRRPAAVTSGRVTAGKVTRHDLAQWWKGQPTLAQANEIRRGREMKVRGATISGTVTDSAGQPLADIEVLAATNTGGDIFDVCTKPDGTYSLSPLPPAQYVIAFSNGCGAAGSYVPQFFDNQTDSDAANLVKVGAGQDITGIDARMRPGAIITGGVTSGAGQPVRKICVTAESPGEANSGAEIGLSLVGPQARTGTSGTYRIRNLAAGRYAVHFTECGAPRYADRWFGGLPGAVTGDIVDVGAGGRASGISAVMSPGGAISGTVRSSTGQRLDAGCEVVTNLRTGAVALSGLGIASAYIVKGLAPGPYSVEFYSCVSGANYAQQWFSRQPRPAVATTVHVTAGHTRTSVSAALHRGGKIAGQLTSKATGKPVASFCVDATTAGGTFFGSAFTGHDGRYVVSGLHGGRYHLAFTNCDETAATVAGSRRTRPVRVTPPRKVSGINAALPAGGSISGDVLAGSPAPTGQDHACVEADPVTAGVPGTSRLTSHTGRYVLPNLAAGKYQVFFATRTDCDNSQDGLIPQWYNGVRSRAMATPVTVRRGRATAGIDATLRADGGISGTVTAGSTSTPLAGACVRAVPQAGGRSASFTVSSEGGYSLTGLVPGAYTVRFSSGCGVTGLATQWWDDATSVAAATVITVTAGTVTTGIDAALTS